MHEYWRGGVEAWECDEMGHMNVRFWSRRAMDALAWLERQLGLPAELRLVMRDQHIKFLKEAAAGTPLYAVGGVIDVLADGLRVYLEIRHSRDDAIGATFINELACVRRGSLAPQPLPASVAEAARTRLVQLPDHALPRSVPVERPLRRGSLAVADAAGFRRVGLSMVRASDLDGEGLFLPEGFIGRVSEAVPTLMAGWREEAAEEASALDGVARRAGAAVLEYRLSFLAWPGAGDVVAVSSGVMAVADKTMTLNHWLLDPVSGAPWCVAEAVAITFDLNARKAIATPPRARAALEAMLVRLDP